MNLGKVVRLVVIGLTKTGLRAYWADGYVRDENRMLAAGRRYSRKRTATGLRLGTWQPEEGFRSAVERGLKSKPGVVDVIYLYLARRGFIDRSKLPALAGEIERDPQPSFYQASSYRGLILVRNPLDQYSDELTAFVRRWGMVLRPEHTYQRYQQFEADVLSVLGAVLAEQDADLGDSGKTARRNYLARVGLV